MHITELRAENIKRLVAVRVKPDGSLVVVGGNNGQGKTSLLDSIAMALGGKDLMPAEPLRRCAAAPRRVRSPLRSTTARPSSAR